MCRTSCILAACALLLAGCREAGIRVADTPGLAVKAFKSATVTPAPDGSVEVLGTYEYGR